GLRAERVGAGRGLGRHARLAALDGRAALARYVLQRLDARRVAPETPGRLRVLELHQARALPFRRAVLVGANDRALPRRASEDFFLPDVERRALRDATGRPGPPRRAARRDDALLSDPVCAAVHEELVVTCARADAEARDASPSPFLRRLGLDPRAPARLVPRSPRAEIDALRATAELLAPNEALAGEI